MQFLQVDVVYTKVYIMLDVIFSTSRYSFYQMYEKYYMLYILPIMHFIPNRYILLEVIFSTSTCGLHLDDF